MRLNITQSALSYVDRFGRSATQRLEYLSIPEPNSGCWIWLGSVGLRGYGLTFLKPMKASVRAHRLSYTVHKGDIPEGLDILHKCDNPLCINPEHLVAGTHQENMDDMTRKGRRVSIPSDQCHLTKLSWDIVTLIRGKARTGVSYEKLAVEFGVWPTTISSIVRGKTWKISDERH